MATKTAKLIIRRNAAGNAYLQLRAANGEILLTSESYDSPANARRAAASLLTLAATGDVLFRDETAKVTR